MEGKRKRMLTVAESASYLGRSTKTIRRYVKQGILSCERVNGKFGPEMRIPRKELDSLVRKMTNPTGPEKEALDLLRLYRKATPEIRELVHKILSSDPTEEMRDSPGLFRLSFFRKKGGKRS